MRDYDIHVYYTEATRAKASAMREKALATFAGRPIHISRLVDRPIGPHPVPMFEIDFDRSNLAEMIEWLFANRDGLTVLIHQVTGHDNRDHSDGAMWMGEVLQLDFSIFDT